MGRITDCFNHLHQENCKGLIAFIVAGDPKPEFTLALMDAMVNAGVDLIELGVPFSDPMADGPVIQRASERALLNNTSLNDTIDMVTNFRKKNKQTPVILMSYTNPIEVLGYEEFSKSAAEAGVDGALVVDMPPEEAKELREMMLREQLDLIFLLSLTTSTERIKYISGLAQGFLYYVSLKGVTGSDKLNVHSVQESVSVIKQHSNLPVGVGFGIRNATAAIEVAKFSDAVVIGSAIVEMMEQAEQGYSDIIQSIADYISTIKYAINNN